MSRSKARLSYWKIGGILFGIYVIFSYFTLPSGSEFKNSNPKTTAFIDAKKEEALDNDRPSLIKMTWLPLGEISPYLVKAVIASEDTAFFSHEGFDLGELQKVVIESIETFTFPRGASTITQQLAKNLYLSPSRNPIRKLKEALITIRLERTLSKRRILELYLNVIELGPLIFGVEEASRYYFGTSARNLGPSEAAFIAAIIPNPLTTFNPKLHPQRVAKRKGIILRRIGG